MMDGSSIDANFGRLAALHGDFSAHHAASVATLDDLVANLRATLTDPAWAGPIGRSAYDAVHAMATATHESLNTIYAGATNLVGEVSQLWPAVENFIGNIWEM